MYRFNPRTHEECDYGKLINNNLDIIVSIHALTKSATAFEKDYPGVYEFQSTHSRRVRLASSIFGGIKARFQSTHSRRVRHAGCYWILKLIKFQSTHSRRVRLAKQNANSHQTQGFNPRTHEECDRLFYIILFCHF